MFRFIETIKGWVFGKKKISENSEWKKIEPNQALLEAGKAIQKAIAGSSARLEELCCFLDSLDGELKTDFSKAEVVRFHDSKHPVYSNVLIHNDMIPASGLKEGDKIIASAVWENSLQAYKSQETKIISKDEPLPDGFFIVGIVREDKADGE